MRILALDTSTMIACVALLEDNITVCEITTKVNKGHSSGLIHIIEHALSIPSWKLNSIGLIVVGRGPGSFTGIRIGIATAKGIAMAVGVPIAGVCTLDALAYAASPSHTPIVPVMDAKKGEVFCALYSQKGEPLSPYYNIKPDAITKICRDDALFIGDGLEKYGDILARSMGSRFSKGPKCLWYPKASVMGLMGMKTHDNSPRDVQPIYVRPSDATLLLNKSTKTDGVS